MLSVSEIKRFIDDDSTSEKKRLAAVGQRYYDAKHDILKCRFFFYNTDGDLEEDKARSNVKICHPFFTELTDQLSAYMLSFDENPIRAKDNAEGLQDFLDEYFDDDFWSEIGELIEGAYKKGFEYLYAYINENNRLSFQCADSMGVVEVRAKDAEDGQDHIIYWYIDRIEKGRKKIKRIQDWNRQETRFYIQHDNGQIIPDEDELYNPRPHVVFTDPKTGKKMGRPLGYIPFYRLDNCKKQISGLNPIKGLIDDYDLMQCGLSNNLNDFDTPLQVVKGFPGDDLDKLQKNLKTKKIIGIPDAEGGVEVMTIDIPYEARKIKAEEDEKNIYRFGFGFNASQTGDGNITNVVIRSRYTLLDLKANKMEKRLKKLLKEIIKVVLDEINTAHKKDYQLKDIKFVFTRNIMTNETENTENAKIEAETQQIKINTILNMAAEIGDEKVLEAFCEVMEWDYDELKGRIEQLKEEAQSTADAKKLLDDIDTDVEDEGNAGAPVFAPGA